MPYIKQEDRHRLIAEKLAGGLLNPKTPGELNFILTSLCIVYLETHTQCYQTYNDIIGALECCKLELYRRKISSYEDKKIEENGDVY